MLPLRNRKCRSCMKVVKTHTSSADRCVGRSCRCNVERHGVCSADAVFGDGGGDTCVVGGWCANEDAGSSLREELLAALSEYARSRSGQDEDSSRILKKLPSKAQEGERRKASWLFQSCFSRIRVDQVMNLWVNSNAIRMRVPALRPIASGVRVAADVPPTN